MTDQSVLQTVKLDRPPVLGGATYKITAPNVRGDTITVYVTVNEDELGRPYEVFLNCNDAAVVEMLSVSMVLASRALRAGVPSRPSRPTCSRSCRPTPATSHGNSGSRRSWRTSASR